MRRRGSRIIPASSMPSKKLIFVYQNIHARQRPASRHVTFHKYGGSEFLRCTRRYATDRQFACTAALRARLEALPFPDPPRLCCFTTSPSPLISPYRTIGYAGCGKRIFPTLWPAAASCPTGRAGCLGMNTRIRISMPCSIWSRIWRICYATSRNLRRRCKGSTRRGTRGGMWCFGRWWSWWIIMSGCRAGADYIPVELCC